MHSLLATTAAGAAACAVFAAPAQATVTRIVAMPDYSVGSATDYATSCRATVQAFATDPVAPVTFYDNGTPFATVRPQGAYALTDWYPAEAGTHTLTAVQDGQDDVPASLTVPVGDGRHIGYACAVL